MTAAAGADFFWKRLEGNHEIVSLKKKWDFLKYIFFCYINLRLPLFRRFFFYMTASSVADYFLKRLEGYHEIVNLKKKSDILKYILFFNFN